MSVFVCTFCVVERQMRMGILAVIDLIVNFVIRAALNYSIETIFEAIQQHLQRYSQTTSFSKRFTVIFNLFRLCLLPKNDNLMLKTFFLF